MNLYSTFEKLKRYCPERAGDRCRNHQRWEALAEKVVNHPRSSEVGICGRDHPEALGVKQTDGSSRTSTTINCRNHLIVNYIIQEADGEFHRVRREMHRSGLKISRSVFHERLVRSAPETGTRELVSVRGPLYARRTIEETMSVLSHRASGLKPSPTLAIQAKAKSMQAQGINVISFGAGEPDFDTPDNIKRAAVRAIEEGFTKYTAVGGIDELKDAIIHKFQRDNGLTYKRSQILVSCGGKHSFYNLAQSLFDRGDEVIVPAPYWVCTSHGGFGGTTPVILETREQRSFKMTPRI
jgi:hypothetical protein